MLVCSSMFSVGIRLTNGFNEPELLVDCHVVCLFFLCSANTAEDGALFFSLYKGQTEATNKDNTFTFEPDPNNINKALIKLDKLLDYEKVNEYTLTLRASVSMSVLEVAVVFYATFFVCLLMEEEPWFLESKCITPFQLCMIPYVFPCLCRTSTTWPPRLSSL